MKVTTKSTRDFRFGGTGEQFGDIQTTWPTEVKVEVAEAADSQEHYMMVFLGTRSRTLATRRARDLVKKIERSSI